MKIIGSKIRYYRKAIGLTGKELGELTGIGRSGISKIESGTINVTIGTLTIISEHLKVKPVNLME